MGDTSLPRDTLDSVFKLVRRAFRFWWLAAVILVVGGAMSFVVARARGYKYISEAVVLYQEGINLNLTQGEGGPGARRMGSRLRDTILARTNLLKVIEETKLAPLTEDRIKTSKLIEDVRKAIRFRVNDGDTFSISYMADNPRVAQAVTAKIVDMLIEQNTRMRAEQAEITREFLDSERRRTEEALRLKEIELARFLAKHPEFAQEPAAGAASGAAVRATATKAGRTEAAGDSALSALRREEARLRQQIANPSAVQMSNTTDPALLQAIREAEARVNTAKRELGDRRSRFTEQHPDVRAAAAAVRQAEDALKRAVDAARASDRSSPTEEVIEIEPKAALQARLAQVQAEIRRRENRDPTPEGIAQASAESNDAAARIVALETDWARINRELAEARDRFQKLDVRQFAASITASSLASGRAARIEVVDPAYLPGSPAGATPRRVMLMGTAGALLLGMCIALGLALLDDHIYDRRDVDALAVSPVLVEIPRFKAARARRG